MKKNYGISLKSVRKCGTNFEFGKNFLSVHPQKNHQRQIQINLGVYNLIYENIFNKLRAK